MLKLRRLEFSDGRLARRASAPIRDVVRSPGLPRSAPASCGGGCSVAPPPQPWRPFLLSVRAAAGMSSCVVTKLCQMSVDVVSEFSRPHVLPNAGRP